MGSVRPDCCTEHLLELLFFLEDLMNAHGVFHWLDHGALLGAVRNEQLIPWDDDADFGMLTADVPALLGLEPEITAAGHRLESRRTSDGTYIDRVRVEYSPVNSLHVEFFAWNRESELLVNDMSKDSNWPGMRGTMDFPVHYIEQLQPVRLHGREFAAPSPVGEFLERHRFGPDYLTPKRSLSVGLAPAFSSDEMSPLVEALLERLRLRQQEWYALAPQKVGSRWHHWTQPGLPKDPSPEFVEAVYGSIDSGERSPAVDHLVGSIARIDQAIAERTGPLRLRVDGARRRIRHFQGRLANASPRYERARTRRKEWKRNRARRRKARLKRQKIARAKIERRLPGWLRRS